MFRAPGTLALCELPRSCADHSSPPAPLCQSCTASPSYAQLQVWPTIQGDSFADSLSSFFVQVALENPDLQISASVDIGNSMFSLSHLAKSFFCFDSALLNGSLENALKQNAGVNVKLKLCISILPRITGSLSVTNIWKWVLHTFFF